MSDFNIGDYNIVVCFNSGIGYQVDLIKPSQYNQLYLDGKIDPEATECRDYGEDIDVERANRRLLYFIRNYENTTLVNNDFLKEIRDTLFFAQTALTEAMNGEGDTGAWKDCLNELNEKFQELNKLDI